MASNLLKVGVIRKVMVTWNSMEWHPETKTIDDDLYVKFCKWDCALHAILTGETWQKNKKGVPSKINVKFFEAMKTLRKEASRAALEKARTVEDGDEDSEDEPAPKRRKAKKPTKRSPPKVKQSDRIIAGNTVTLELPPFIHNGISIQGISAQAEFGDYAHEFFIEATETVLWYIMNRLEKDVIEKNFCLKGSHGGS